MCMLVNSKCATLFPCLPSRENLTLRKWWCRCTRVPSFTATTEVVVLVEWWINSTFNFHFSCLIIFYYSYAICENIDKYFLFSYIFYKNK